MKTSRARSRGMVSTLGICIALAGWCLFPLGIEHAVRQSRWSESVSNQMAALKAKNEWITLGQLDAEYPRRASSATAASRYARAFSASETRKDHPLLSDDALRAVGIPLTPEQRELIAEYVSRNSRCLQLLRAAESYDSCRYPIDLTNGFRTFLPHLSKIKECGDLLALESIYHADAGNGPRAAQSILTSLRLARSLDDEPITLSYLVQTAVLVRSCRTLEWCLSRCEFGAVDLQAIRDCLQGALSDRTYRRTLAGERCTGIAAFEGRTSDLQSLMDDATIRLRLELWIYRISGFWMRDFGFYLDLMGQLSAIQELPPHLRLDRIAALEQRLAENQGRERKAEVRIISGMFLPATLRVSRKEVGRQAELRLAITALSAQLGKPSSKSPASSESRGVPATESVLLDPYDGRPLRVSKSDAGLLIYSVGPDRSDDHGRTKPKANSNAPYDITFEVRR